MAVRDGDYGTCSACGGERTWTPRGFMTDLCGSEVVDNVLRTADGKPLRYRSTRDRESQMRAMGYEPAGDKVGGARNNDGYKRSHFSFSGQRSHRDPQAPIVRR